LAWCVAREWRMPGYHFVQNHAETPDVSGFINPADCRTRLLGRHIANSPEDRAKIGVSECHRSCPVRRSRPLRRSGCEGWIGEGGFGELCNPKVEHFHVPIRPEHDVLRFDVAMDDSCFMRGGERTRHLDGDVNSFTQLHRTGRQTLTQGLAFDQFAGYVMN